MDVSSNKPLQIRFQNPSNLPLEKLHYTVKVLKGPDQQVKAIDAFWLKRPIYCCYMKMPKRLDVSADKMNLWQRQANDYLKTLEFLLKLPLHKFWSYIVYDGKLPEFLEQFLEDAVPAFLTKSADEFNGLYNEIYNSVIAIYLRVFQFKESQTNYITPKIAGNLLKSSSLITNFVLWDLTRIYGYSFPDELTNMFEIAYKIVPTLADELKSISIANIFDMFEIVGRIAYENDVPTSKEIQDISLLVYDVSFSLNSFIRIYPRFKEICISENVFIRIAHIYDNELPLLTQLMNSILDEEDVNYKYLLSTKVELLNNCHNLTSYCMDRFFNCPDNNEQLHWADTYLNLILSVIDQTEFILHFNALFPIASDVETLRQICQTIDMEKCRIILNKIANVEFELESDVPSTSNLPSNSASALDEARLPDSVYLDSKVSELLDMFPHLGDGFLQKCLVYMDMDSEAVTMAILENNLPSALSSLDQSEPRIPPEEEQEVPRIENNENSYVGKKPTMHRNVEELLDDKSHISELKDRFTAYGLINDDPIYDDDYDDSYEISIPVPDFDDSEKNPIKNPHKFNKQSESDESDAEESTSGAAPSKDAFCEDPAIIRARREAKYQQRQPNRARDVVGKPKGEGQEKTVQQNRDKKNTNKSARGNHNRRSGAAWKRNRGMIPS